ncbi:MAG: TlpA family protein disulfide reductase [Candidatus Promineifilaceae bacterium]|jgi:thiol-disulfide isomerase/thioredoxin
MALKSSSYFLIILTILFTLVACGPLSEGAEESAELPPTSTPSQPADTSAAADTSAPADTSAASDTSAPAPTPAPAVAPNFTLFTLDGGELSLSDYEGEWVIVNFWATWCPPCVSEMPYLQSLADRGINVIGINLTDTADDVKKFTAQHGIQFPILMEPDINTVLDYQARQLPRTVIVAPDGTIALRVAGAVDGEHLDPWLEAQGVN